MVRVKLGEIERHLNAGGRDLQYALSGDKGRPYNILC